MTDTDDDMFAGMIAEAVAPTARAISGANGGLCSCGSGQHHYNLFDHKGNHLLLCCYRCEKARRAWEVSRK